MKGQPIEIKLDVREYQIPAQDDKGHSGRIEFRVNVGLLREVEILLQDAKTLTGWKTNSEFYRWAIWSGMRTLAARCKSERLTNMLRLSDYMIRSAQRTMVEARLMDSIEHVHREVQELSTRGRTELIPGHLLAHQKLIAQIDLPEWKDWMQTEFNRRFGHLIKGVSLTDYEK